MVVPLKLENILVLKESNYGMKQVSLNFTSYRLTVEIKLGTSDLMMEMATFEVGFLTRNVNKPCTDRSCKAILYQQLWSQGHATLDSTCTSNTY